MIAARELRVRITSLSGVPLVAERSICYGPDWTVGTNGVGTPTLSTEWLFQEGGTGPFWDTFILLANPSSTTATVWPSRATTATSIGPSR